MKLRYIAVSVAIIFFISLILFPHVIYDEFIWKYFVGPVVADAVGHPVSYHGVAAKEGYSIISELFYGLILILFLYFLYLFFERYGVKVNLKFILSSLPFILYGSISRVLEDAGIFEKPLSYLFISPVIYIQIGILFFISIIYGIYFKGNKKFLYGIVTKNAIYVILYLSILSVYSKYTLNPLIFALFSIISFGIYYKCSEKDYNAVLLSFGFLAFVSSFYLLIYFAYKEGYIDSRILIAPLIALFITLLIYFASKYSNFELLKNRINNLLVFGHMLDAVTTYFAVVDPLNFGIKYGEKHPLPDFLMKNFHGIGYPLLKLFVVIGIIYAIDDLKLNLKNTIKFFILFLGLSPGLRDLLRILIGV
ncbi:MAG TPA: DUF63 family protein [Thermoplasmatales archaeon]|nr:DUF63 family protein [Thermoplasmatales archaeon]